jgi:triphosphatase
VSPRAIELNLSGDPDVLERLWMGPTVAGAAMGPPVSDSLESVYFDTAKRRLYRRGISFRVRSTNGGYAQAVKSGDLVGSLGRNGIECESRLRSPNPRFDLVSDPGLRDRVGPFKPGDLRPVFKTRYRHSVRRLGVARPDHPVAKIDASFDIGEIEVGKRSVPISEIGLRLKEGSTEAIYDLALALFEEGPVRIEVCSKSARGYALAKGRPPITTGGWAVALERSATVDEAISAIFGKCFDHWIANEAAAVDGQDPEGVHQVRVALRRMRSAVDMFRKVVPKDHARWLRSEARWLASHFGPARDWDVFLDSLLQPVLEADPNDGALLELRAVAAERRESAYESVRETVRSRDLSALELTFGAWLDRHGWRHGAGGKRRRRAATPIEVFAETALSGRRSDVYHLGRDIEKLPFEKLHRLRIELKNFRYMIEFFGGLFPKQRYQRYRKSLSHLQDQLGHLNDVATAQHLLSELVARADTQRRRRELRSAAKRVMKRQHDAMSDFRTEAARRWQAFNDTPPCWNAHSKRR